MSRFYQDHPHEKGHLAAFAVRKFFVERGQSQRCFVQASSMALYLAYALESDPSVPDRCLFYSNSVVFYLPLLYGKSNGRHSIWPFCGHAFDSHCAGWLIPQNDGKSFTSLRELFERGDDRLTTAFLMPRYITPKDGVFYERSDSAMFADTLAHADEVIVLSTGDRLLDDSSHLPSDKKFYPALQRKLTDSPAKITFVVSRPTDSEIPPSAHALRKVVGHVFWQSRAQWTEMQPA
jgi:hypothetical protein